ncbi:DUF222 domain-containing protein [Actinomadura barringtoniae]|uniref:DUF222 domain-containing protein n=1 Tax=Actinomadura barringtoniae TaxID=1427535 RepID=A0A939PLQ1_9ACTN|nr:HNH endonuclease signature motif containing protein [Actinomadura barringtoniae]MBO2452204.1 DUF222 domain-containing protein [Actinomadura barringtoniae]
MSSVVLDTGTASTTQLVQAAAAIAAELAHRDPTTGADLTPAAAMQQAETIAAAIDLHETTLARLIGMVDGAGVLAEWALPSTLAWLRNHLGMREGRAKDRLTYARQLPRLPQVAKRAAAADLSYGYAATIASAVHRLDDADCGKAEGVLLGLVDEGWSAGKIAAFGKRITDLIAERDGSDTPPEDAAHGYERSWLDTSRSLDGGRYVRGWLNAEDAAVLDGALGTLTKPAGTDDLRDHSERTAAALMVILAGGHKDTRVTIIVDLDTLTGGQAPARLLDGSPVPAEQARRIALSAGVSPLILGPGNLPLYLGRTVRIATAAQRRVLETLYATCAMHGCEVPAALCEVDHVDGWALGDSPTDIDKLALCCGWHNRWKHTHPDRMHISHDNGRYTYRALPPNEHWRARPSRTGFAWTSSPPPAASDPPGDDHRQGIRRDTGQTNHGHQDRPRPKAA